MFSALTAHISLCQTQRLKAEAISFAAAVLWQYQEQSGNKLNVLKDAMQSEYTVNSAETTAGRM